MRLVATIDTLHLSVPPARHDGSTGDEWRPPRHPASLLGAPRRRAAAGAPPKGKGPPKGPPPPPSWQPPSALPAAGAETARSDASTVSDAEWPEELVLG